MSVVAVKINDDKTVHVSADTQNTTNNVIGYYSKVFIHEGIVYGAVGSAEELSMLKLFVKKYDQPIEPTEQSILELFVAFAEYLEPFKKEFAAPENDYIVVLQGQGFSINGFMVDRIKNYYAMGSGRDFALMAMELGQSAEGAVMHTCKFDIYCNLPAETFLV